MKIITARPNRLLSQVIARIGENVRADRRCMLLVPSQYTLQAEIEVMEQLRLDGTFMIDVLSPGRLQGRIFERAGAPKRTIFDERGKCMVLCEIIAREKDSLTIYRASAQQAAPGFASRMSALIADFKRSGLSAQDLLESLAAMDDAQRSTPAAKKLADAAHIFSAYEARMAGRLADAEDVSQEMLSRMARSGVLENQHVFIYGFDMITPTFAREIVHMASLADSMTLAVETDDNAAPDGRLFAPVNFSLQRLCAAAGKAGIPVEREKLGGEIDAPQDVRRMERQLFALGAKAVGEAPQHIELRAVSSPRREAHVAASRIRRLAHEGVALEDVAVVYPKGSGYAPLLAGILPLYGVSAYIAEKRSAGAHPLCRFVIAALAVVSGGWRAADLIEYVQSGFSGLSRAQCDALCSYIEGMDVRADSFKKPFTYVKEGGAETLAALNESREAVCAPLTALHKALKAASDADDTIAAVIALLESVHAFDTLGDMRMALMQQGLASEAQDCAQVWNALMETLDQLHTLLSGSGAPAKLVMKLLESGLAALELSALPPADGAVVCGEIGNVRTAKVKYLFALGMNDAGAPQAGGLLTPQEQEETARRLNAYLGMSQSERAALSQLDELKTLCCAGERLIVSYAIADETGRALREGAFVQALRRLFQNLPLKGGVLDDETEAMLTAPQAALEALSVRLSAAADGKGDIPPAYRQAYAALQESEEGRERLLAVTRRLSAQADKMLPAAQARALYGRPVMSVSRLESFAQCPYRHFVRYGLSPKEAAKPGVDRAQLGTLYHEAAERFTQAVTQLSTFPQVDGATCDRLMDEAVVPLLESWRQSPMGESERGAAIARRVHRTARRAGRNIVSQFAGSGFRPMQSEMVFGRDGAAPIMLELPGGTFAFLQGRIDRIDVYEDGENGTHVRVIDYKSGSKTFDPTMVYFGIQLQLLLYLAAALSQLPGAKPAGFFYCRISDPTIRTESRIKEEIEKQIAKKLALAGISLSDVSILRAQDARHAGMISKDGTPSGTYKNSMVDEAGMQSLVRFAREKAGDLAADVYRGRISDEPAVFGQYDACATCDYSAVCGFDPTVRRRKRLTRKHLADLCGASPDSR